MHRRLESIAIVLLALFAAAAVARADEFFDRHEEVNPFDFESVKVPFLWEQAYNPDSIYRLTDADFFRVADELGVEVAAIKAVVEIEAGKTHQGFAAPRKPLINFDLKMFQSFAAKRGIGLGAYRRSHPLVFNSTSRTQTAVHRRLEQASTINRNLAVEATFWGMFQIGGFNWKKCGAESIDDFVEKMSRSERDQLELFAHFITDTGLLKYLRAKNWTAFARGYNGNSYAVRGYHTKLARAYRKYKAMEQRPVETEEE